MLQYISFKTLETALKEAATEAYEDARNTDDHATCVAAYAVATFAERLISSLEYEAKEGS